MPNDGNRSEQMPQESSSQPIKTDALPPFPEQRQLHASGVANMMIVTVLGAVASPVLKRFWPPLGLVALLPALLLGFSLLSTAFRNCSGRLEWLALFPARILIFRITRAVRREPSRFQLFVFHYHRIGYLRVAPVFVLRDKATKVDGAVWPSSLAARRTCERLGVPIMDVSVHAEYLKKKTANRKPADNVGGSPT